VFYLDVAYVFVTTEVATMNLYRTQQLLAGYNGSAVMEVAGVLEPQLDA
jgi:hypothetical protein